MSELTPAVFGRLGSLPPEVRSMIWDHLLPEHDSRSLPVSRENSRIVHNYLETGSSIPTTRSHLAILYTHPILYQEIYPKLGKPGVLYLSVEHDKYGWFWKEEKDSPLPPTGLPWLRAFYEINFDIYAPDVTDPGQLINLRHNVLHLVIGLLDETPLFRDSQGPYNSATSTLKYMEILGRTNPRSRDLFAEFREPPRRLGFNFNNHGSISWFSGLFAHSSCSATNASDLQIIMSVFKYINWGARADIQIKLPSQARELHNFDDLADKIRKQWRPFGSFSGNEINTEQRETTWVLDTALDETNGLSAAHLRRERFKMWNAYVLEIMSLRAQGYSPTRGFFSIDVPLRAREQVLKILKTYIDGAGNQRVYAEDEELMNTHLWSYWYPEGIPILSSIASTSPWSLCRSSGMS